MIPRLPILLAQLKAGNNPQKLKNEAKNLSKTVYNSFMKMETIFMNTLNSRTNESSRFVYQFTDKLNLKNPSKNIALANLSIHYTWRNIISEYNLE